MKNLTIRRRIIVSFAVVLALMVAMAVVAYTRLLDIEHQAGLMASDTVPGLTYANQIVVERTASYSLTQEFLLQTDMAAKQKLHAAIIASRTHLDALMDAYAGTDTTPGETTLFEALKGSVVRYRTAQDGLLAAGLDSTMKRDENVKRLGAELQPEFAKVQAAAAALADYNRSALVDSTHRIVASAASAKAGVLVTVGVALAVAFFCGYFLHRSI